MKKRLMLLFAAFTLCAISMMAQNLKVTGVVTSEMDGQPVVGAFVTVKGVTDGGTITDVDGKFEMSVPSDAKVIVFSCLGMETVEIAIRPYLTVTMRPDTEILEGVDRKSVV